MKKILLSGIALLTALSPVYAQKVSFDKIQHWAGKGEKKAALLVQFNDGKTDEAFVWGYRWDGTASGEDMIRAIAAQSRCLAVLVQYTGSMGSTLNGVGLSAGREFLDYLEYDFKSAAEEEQVSFGYYTPETSMGQTSAPGDNTPNIIAASIEGARETGIIEHPLNARRYGYPAYDYDFWGLNEIYKEAPEYHWQSGWYNGYWSYWTGVAGEDLSYSGLGMSSVQLADGSANLWNYDPDMAVWGESPEPSQNLNYAMTEYGEEMKEAVLPVYSVDFDKIKYWVGEGEKFAAVVVKFNDGLYPEDIVIGYRWTGGWDDRVEKALPAVLKGDNRFSAVFDGSNVKTLSFNYKGDGTFDETQRKDVAGEWKVYGDYTNEAEIFELNNNSYVNPRSVIILARTPENGEADYTVREPYYEGVITGIHHIGNETANVKALADGTLLLSDCAGYEFNIVDMTGRTVDAFRCHDSFATYSGNMTPGVYILTGKCENNVLSVKYTVK